MNFISGLLFFLAFIPYIWSIIHGVTTPSSISWVIWASIDTLALIAMKKEKATSGQLTGAVAGAWAVTFLAFFYGKFTMGITEWISITGAIMGIVFWKIKDDPIIFIICSQMIVLVATIPTAMGAYNFPEREDSLSWSLWFISGIFAMMAIKKWDIANTLQPLTFLTVDAIVFTLVVIRPYLI